VQLIPDEPNPYDSYAELLMKVGRFAESITQYEKALKVDPNFVASYVGIANDQVFLGKPQEARKVLAKLEAIARNDGERRLACTWTAASYLHEGNTKSALGEVERRYQIAKKGKDGVAMAADLNLMGNILLEAGQADAALSKFKAGIIAIDAADATAEVKAATHRNHLYDLVRVALLRKDVASAAETAQQYRTQVEARKIPFEVWRTHELIGLVAFAKGDFERAVVELEQANQQDPRVVFELGEAYAAVGKADLAKVAFARAAGFNGLGINYGYVRAKALAKLKG
jgi:tetratricopeptide (TPR) repeat protein